VPTRILQLSDFHLFKTTDNCYAGIPVYDSLVEVLRFVQDNYANCDRIVITGDMTHDGTNEAYNQLRQVIDPFVSRCLFIPGNHDRRESISEVFPEAAGDFPGKITFSVVVNGWRLIGLDSLIEGQVDGSIDRCQLQWLRTQLQSHSDQKTFIFIHHPPISVDCAWLDKIGLTDNRELVQLISESDQIQAIFTGHVHQEFSGTIGNVPVLGVPSTCIQFAPHSQTPTYDSMPPGLRIIEFNDDNFCERVIRLPEINYVPDQLQS